MESLTLLFFLLAVGVFILTAYRRNPVMELLTLVIGGISLAATLTDETVVNELTWLIIVDFMIIAFSVYWAVWPSKGVR